MTMPNRKPSGTPTGGQFAATGHRESAVTLGAVPNPALARVDGLTPDAQAVAFQAAADYAGRFFGERTAGLERRYLGTAYNPHAFAAWYRGFGCRTGASVSKAFATFTTADEAECPVDEPDLDEGTGRDHAAADLTYELDDEQDPVRLAHYAGHEHPWLRQSVAGNPRALQSTLRRLIEDPAPVVRRNVAANLTDLHDLKRMVTDADGVTATAAGRQLRRMQRRNREVKAAVGNGITAAVDRVCDNNDQQSGWVDESARRRYLALARSGTVYFTGDGRIDLQLRGSKADLQAWGSLASDLLDGSTDSDRSPPTSRIVEVGSGRAALIW